MENEEYRVPRMREERLKGPKVIVLLDQAWLELTGGPQKRPRLLTQMNKGGENKDRNLQDARPDICHQCLMMLLDSPLNKAGKLCVFIRTADSQLIEVHPQLTVPRTWKQFSALMVTFLMRRKIKAQENSTTLLRLVKNSPEVYLPPGSRKIGLSVNGNRVVLRDFCQQVVKSNSNNPIVFVIGAVAKSDPASSCDFLDESISISDHSLSAAICCGKVCTEFEALWSVP